MIFYRDPVISQACAISAEVLQEELRVERLIGLIHQREEAKLSTESAGRAVQAAIAVRNRMILALFPELGA